MKVESKNRTFFFTLFTIMCFINIYGQNKDSNRSLNSILETYTKTQKNTISSWNLAKQRSKSADAYQFMALRGDLGFISELSFTGNTTIISKGVFLINNIMSAANISKEIEGNKTYKDNFKGWICLRKNDEYHREVPLYESYSFFYITQFLYILKNNGWVDESETNHKWWLSAIEFVEQNMWRKWVSRSKEFKNNDYGLLLRSRVHMGSHWAGIAMYLGALTNDTEIKRQTEEVQNQYNMLLKRNLKTINDCYYWNSTYDDVEGTDAIGVKKPIVQDVSHANHVVVYIIAAYEFGNNSDWTKNDILKLSNTLKNVIYDKNGNFFHDNVDGTEDKNRPGWGNFIADGWSKLAKYDVDIRNILVKFEKTDNLLKYYQSMQYEASMYKSLR